MQIMLTWTTYILSRETEAVGCWGLLLQCLWLLLLSEFTKLDVWSSSRGSRLWLFCGLDSVVSLSQRKWTNGQLWTQTLSWGIAVNLRSRTCNFKLSSQYDDHYFIHRMLFANYSDIHSSKCSSSIFFFPLHVSDAVCHHFIRQYIMYVCNTRSSATCQL